ncbi:MAG: pyruvate kinase [Candidatus Altiarchaeota archaeon]|nr:pyruvate kinase [Candidatus Altiarchaeota archaeon]
MFKKTKILCTIGPASEGKRVLSKMVKAGMNAFRINTAYGSLKEYERKIKTVWSVARIPVVVDLKGPEVRMKCETSFMAQKGDIVSVGFKPSDKVSFNRSIYSQIHVGDIILLDKGKVKSKIIAKSKGKIKLKLYSHCCFRNGLGVNIPDNKLDIPALSSHDKDVIKLCKRLDVDYVALSFTRDIKDVLELKRRLRGSSVGVIAKIENRQGIQNIDDIIGVCDGVMIARGDLGIEIPFQEIPLVQKDIITRCNSMGKISIVATEMMQSMVENPEPTRAETSDVANAILDGADCVMLSAESAVGKYPIASVKAMAEIALEVETHHPIRPLDEKSHDKVSLAISKAVTSIIETADVDKIVVATHTGYTAMLISNFRICKDIIAITDNSKTCRKMNLVYAVVPVCHSVFKEKDRVVEIAKFCFRKKLVSKNDLVLFTAGLYNKKPTTNIVQLHKMSEILSYRATN